MELYKECKECKVHKDISEFYPRKDSLDGYRNICKKCGNDDSKRYRQLNKHPKVVKLVNIEDKKANRKEIHKRYRENNIEKVREKGRNYQKENKENRNKNRNIKKQIDSSYALKCVVRSLTRNSLRNKGFKKNTKTELLLGCSFIEFKLYLESKFESWMTYENHGKYNGEINYGWDVDHIIPLSSANTEEEIIKLSHYTNLQPLCSYINRNIKKNNITF